MTFFSQKFIVRAIWLIALVDAARQGFTLPSSELTSVFSHSEQFKIYIALFGLLIPSVAVLFSVFIEKFVPRLSIFPTFGLPSITKWIDQRWGENALSQFMQALQPVLLTALSSLVLGSVGLISCVHANASGFAFEIASFFLAGGFGFIIARMLSRRLSENHFYHF